MTDSQLYVCVCLCVFVYAFVHCAVLFSPVILCLSGWFLCAVQCSNESYEYHAHFCIQCDVNTRSATHKHTCTSKIDMRPFVFVQTRIPRPTSSFINIYNQWIVEQLQRIDKIFLYPNNKPRIKWANKESPTRRLNMDSSTGIMLTYSNQLEAPSNEPSASLSQLISSHLIKSFLILSCTKFWSNNSFQKQ